MPDPVSGTGQARSGIQNILKLLDSGFRRNDKKWCFLTFYKYINFKNGNYINIPIVNSHLFGDSPSFLSRT